MTDDLPDALPDDLTPEMKDCIDRARLIEYKEYEADPLDALEMRRFLGRDE